MRKRTFKEIAIGERFFCNGNLCVKKSTKTATLLQYDRTFYFNQKDIVFVEIN